MPRIIQDQPNNKQKPTKRKSAISLTTKHLPTKVKPVKNTKNTTSYYHCLADSWGKGKITDCCAKCKKQAGILSSLRTAEIRKLSEAYQQVGVSLTNLLQPLKSPKH